MVHTTFDETWRAEDEVEEPAIGARRRAKQETDRAVKSVWELCRTAQWCDAADAGRIAAPIAYRVMRVRFGDRTAEMHHEHSDTPAFSGFAFRSTSHRVFDIRGSDACLSEDPRVRFATLVHDLEKGTSPQEQWPHHHGHEERGVEIILGFCQRYRIPNDYRDLAVLVARYYSHCHRARRKLLFSDTETWCHGMNLQT